MNSGRGEPSEVPRTANRARRWSTAIGALIGVAGAVFVLRSLLSNRDQIAQAMSQGQPDLLLAALILVGLAMSGLGLAWLAWVRALGGSLGVARALRSYFVGQLGKYVPGGIWAILGRAEWARGDGVSAGVSYASVLLSTGSALLAAVMMAVMVLPLSGFMATEGNRPYLLVVVLLPIGFGLLHPRVMGAVLATFERRANVDFRIQVPPWRTSALLVAGQLPIWLSAGTASWVIAAAFGSDGDLANIIVAVAISWAIGFLALPVPSGIGVREAAFVALATSLPTGIAATVAITARLLFMGVDALGATTTSLLLGQRRR